MGLIGSALLLLGLTIKWYFLLDDNTFSVPNMLTWCLIVGSVFLFSLGAVFIVGLHWYVEKKYASTNQENGEEIKKTQEQLRKHRNQSKRYKEKSSWLIWKTKKNLRMSANETDQQSSIANSIKPNSTTIYNTNATESSFQIISNDSYLSDTNSTGTATSFSSTKKLVRTNSKFNQPSLPIIDETKQQSANESYTSPSASSNQTVVFVGDNAQPSDVIIDAKSMPDSKANKTKHIHKLSSGSGKNYILEAFLKQDLTERAPDHQITNQPTNPQTIATSTNNQILNQLGTQSSSQNANGTLNDALDLSE